MGRRGNRRDAAPEVATDWSMERTLAAAEADQAPAAVASDDTQCPCGSREFVLEAMLHVVNGVARPEPLDVETLTCPECGREFEAIPSESGRYLRGDFVGYAELDD